MTPKMESPIVKSFSLFILLLGSMDAKEEKVETSNFIATDLVEYAITMNQSEDECYFARSNGKWGQGGMTSSIYTISRENGEWGAPKIASFSGEFDDSDPHLTLDGTTLYFISNRPTGPGESSPDIWKVQKLDDGTWSIPMRLPEPINSDHTEYSPKTDGAGNLYFASDRPGGFGQGDLYMSEVGQGGFLPPKNMGEQLNSITGEWNLEINPAGDLILFESSQRPENVTSYGDLYISFKKHGVWSIPQNIKELNTSGSDLYPFLSKDAKILYYTSSDSLSSTDTNIYKIDFAPILSNYGQ